jgi:hypothetical protein
MRTANPPSNGTQQPKSNPMKKGTIFCWMLLTAASLLAQIIHIPGDYPTIQAGINAATAGDTVLVAEGTYYEQINFLGKKPLMVASQFLMDGDTNHIGNTIIDGGHITNLDSASVVYFVSGEDTTSILCGFTVQHGKGTYTSTFLERDAGGIWISHAGAKIIHNRITHNTLDDTQPVNGESCIGAGISTDYEDADYWVIIANNVIDSNTCISNHNEASGGGIAISYNSRIVNNIISGNTCTNTGNGASIGGGIDFWANPTWSNRIVATIQNNTITGNKMNAGTAWCGAGYFCGVRLKFSENIVKNNRVESAGPVVNVGAGGLALLNVLEGSVISDNIFNENFSEYLGGALSISSHTPWLEDPPIVIVENNYFIDNEAGVTGGALDIYHCPVLLQNNVFSGNRAGTNPVGDFYQFESINNHWVRLINNSFAYNIAWTNNTGMRFENTNPLIMNCIFWQDSSMNANEIVVSSGSAEIAYSDIDTNAISGSRIIGPGVMAEEPLFKDTVNLVPYHWSPCIDAGVAEYTFEHGETVFAPENDITGVPRPVGNGFDMGAYDQQYWPVGIGAVMNDDLRITNYPNPFSDYTIFEYELKENEKVTLSIFDHLGQEVGLLLNEQQTKGQQKVQWNAEGLPSGIYFYRIQAGKKVGSGKIVKNNR